MNYRALAATFCLLPAVLTAGIAHAAGGMTMTETKTVGSYHVSLSVGLAAAMHMRGVKGTGEMMIAGKSATCSMPKGGGMSMTTNGKDCNHHIEVHVSNARTHRVITNAHVTITMVNNTKHLTIHVPIMTMEGSKGISDFHYGNNVNAPAGRYTITVTVNGTRAVFSMPIVSQI